MRLAVLPLIVLTLLLVGCAPELGDECSTSGDCSVNGDRICDIASPNGYCTVADCEQDTCPEGAVCVQFRYEPERLAQSWCMAPCGDSTDCRKEDGYRCIRATDIQDDEGEPIARVLDEDGDSAKFCAATEAD